MNLLKFKNTNLVNRREWLKGVLLLGKALYFAFLILSGKLSNYINLRFAWLSYVALGVFLLLGIWNLYRLFIRRYQVIQHSNAHLPIAWLGLFLMSLPLLFALFLPSEPLGAEAVSGDISLAPIGGVNAVLAMICRHWSAMCWIGCGSLMKPAVRLSSTVYQWM